MSLKVDLRVPLPSSLEELCAFLAACESAGFDGVGIHDHPETGLDAYTAVAVAAARTTRLDLYVAVTNLATRHPLVLASIAGSMAELAPGRFRLVLGAGNVGVRQVGQSPAGLTELGLGVRAVRELLRGSPVSFAGAPPTSLRSIPAEPPGVLIAGAGPRGLDQALQDADGAFLLAGSDGVVGRWIRERIGDRRDFDVIRVIPVHVARSMNDGRRWFARWWRALDASPRPSDKWIIRSIERWARVVGAHLHLDATSTRMSDLASLAEWVGIFGPPEYCRDRLAEFHTRQGMERAYLWTAHLAEGGDGIPDALCAPPP